MTIFLLFHHYTHLIIISSRRKRNMAVCVCKNTSSFEISRLEKNMKQSNHKKKESFCFNVSARTRARHEIILHLQLNQKSAITQLPEQTKQPKRDSSFQYVWRRFWRAYLRNDDCTQSREKTRHSDAGNVHNFLPELVSESRQCLHPQAAYNENK